MKIAFSVYNLILALWVGGMVMFTIVVTPVIFKSYPRDTASDMVNKLFPVYFPYILGIAAAALVLIFFATQDYSQTFFRLSLILIVLALVVNVYVTFKLFPEVMQVKQEISSFERERREFACTEEVHSPSHCNARLNLFLLADGVALLVISPFLKR